MKHVPGNYDRSFFEDQLAMSSKSAAIVVPLIVSIVQPRSVVDMGCGIGCWTAQFLLHGTSVIGVDGDWADPEMLQIPGACFVSHDLSEQLRLAQTFDLALCLEVAEHLPARRAGGLVSDLVELL